MRRAFVSTSQKSSTNWYFNLFSGNAEDLRVFYFRILSSLMSWPCGWDSLCSILLFWVIDAPLHLPSWHHPHSSCAPAFLAFHLLSVQRSSSRFSLFCSSSAKTCFGFFTSSFDLPFILFKIGSSHAAQAGLECAAFPLPPVAGLRAGSTTPGTHLCSPVKFLQLMKFHMECFVHFLSTYLKGPIAFWLP